MRGAMKHKVRQFESLSAALKELERFIRDPRHLKTGKPFRNFGDMRPREALANWLLCAALNDAGDRDLTFSTDPIGGDGIIRDPATEEAWPTERVMVLAPNRGGPDDLGDLIFEAIAAKRDKGGAAYAAGKTLVVFVEAGGQPWFPNRVARRLPEPLHFAAVWVVGLGGVEDGRYVYHVALLDVGDGDAPTYLVSIESDFTAWSVRRIQ